MGVGIDPCEPGTTGVHEEIVGGYKQNAWSILKY